MSYIHQSARAVYPRDPYNNRGHRLDNPEDKEFPQKRRHRLLRLFHSLLVPLMPAPIPPLQAALPIMPAAIILLQAALPIMPAPSN